MAKHARPVLQQALTLILLNWLITPLVVLGQTQLRVVHLRAYSDQPVELELKIADEVIIGDKTFVAIDDWLKDLSWRMKNTSDKSIVCIDTEYNEIKQFVEQKQPSEGVATLMSAVEMKIATVFFDDQSMWKDGKMLR